MLVRLDRKSLPIKCTLAFNKHLKITVVKSFITMTPDRGQNSNQTLSETLKQVALVLQENPEVVTSSEEVVTSSVASFLQNLFQQNRENPFQFKSN